MIIALVRKELRELLPLILLALLAQLVVVTAAMGISVGLVDQPAQVIPFVGRDIIWYTIVVAGLLAVAAGLRQTMWESAQGTFQFLLHRPVSRQTIFVTKLAVGRRGQRAYTGAACVGLCTVGGDAGHTCQPLLLVDERLGMATVRGNAAVIPGGIHQRLALGPLVRQPFPSGRRDLRDVGPDLRRRTRAFQDRRGSCDVVRRRCGFGAGGHPYRQIARFLLSRGCPWTG